MKKITAKSIEEALIQASKEFGCSVTELEYEVSQAPSAGFLGIGKKDAVIIVDKKRGADLADFVDVVESVLESRAGLDANVDSNLRVESNADSNADFNVESNVDSNLRANFRVDTNSNFATMPPILESTQKFEHFSNQTISYEERYSKESVSENVTERFASKTQVMLEKTPKNFGETNSKFGSNFGNEFSGEFEESKESPILEVVIPTPAFGENFSKESSPFQIINTNTSLEKIQSGFFADMDDEPQNEPRFNSRFEPRESKNFRQDSTQKFSQDSNQNFRQDSHQNSHQDSTQDSYKQTTPRLSKTEQRILANSINERLRGEYEQSKNYAPLDEKALISIQKELSEMLSHLPFSIDTIAVELYDPTTLAITLEGADSALLIGEKGYRYNALSYLLFNWLNPIYGCSVRLEIAQFLRNQEESIERYLEGIIDQVEITGGAKTKPLDGVLGHIALRRLREHFPDKYVSFRQNELNERYIIINEFRRY